MKEMTIPERIKTTVSLREPDQVPVIISPGTGSVLMEFSKLTPKEYYQNREKQFKVQLDFQKRFPTAAPMGIKPDYNRIEFMSGFGFKVIWSDNGPPRIDYSSKKLSELSIPDPLRDGLMPEYLEDNSLDPIKHQIVIRELANLDEAFYTLKVGEIDATFLLPPFDLIAKREGLRVIETPPMCTIWFITILTTISCIEEPWVKDFLLALLEGIAYFKSYKGEALQNMKENWDYIVAETDTRHRLNINDSELMEHLYKAYVQVLETMPYPNPRSITNIYKLVSLKFPDEPLIEHPLEVWDLHPLIGISPYIG